MSEGTTVPIVFNQVHGSNQHLFYIEILNRFLIAATLHYYQSMIIPVGETGLGVAGLQVYI